MDDFKELYRRKAARQYLELDLKNNPALHDVVTLAAEIFQVPIALITFIDEDIQYITNKVGVDDSLVEMPRSTSFCTHAIEQEENMVVEDAKLDERFAEAPVVAGEPHIRFYGGKALRTPEGFSVGTLCVFDVQPQHPNDQQLRLLEMLSTQVENILQLQLEKHRMEQALRITVQQQEKQQVAGQQMKVELQELSRSMMNASLDIFPEEALSVVEEWQAQLKQISYRS